MRNISFALTEPQFLDGSKDVTRRVGWLHLKPGDRLMGVRKAMGLKPGEQIVRLGAIEVVSVRREPLRAMIDDVDYGFEECRREGFGPPSRYQWPSAFVDFFCGSHKGCTPETMVTRIEFRRLP